MAINTEYLVRCVNILETAFGQLSEHQPEEIAYEIYRAACVKEFELVLEQCGRLLRMRLREFFGSNRQADRLSFKDVFRYAAKYCIISADSCERWFEYRDNHNDTVHDYGRGFAEGTLILLPGIIGDAREIVSAIEAGNDD